MTIGTVFFDGGLRAKKNAPTGIGACAAILHLENTFEAMKGLVVRDVLDPIGVASYLGPGHTTNTAEYEGLLLALRLAKQHGVAHVQVVGDSKLVVEQALGAWKVNEPHLKKYVDMAQELARQFEVAEILHVRRHMNKEADKMVTALLDRKTGSIRKQK